MRKNNFSILKYFFDFRSFIEQFFGGSFVYEMKCTESEDEPVTQGKEDFLQLSCFISQDVKFMLSGLKNVSNHLFLFFKITCVRLM